MSEKLPWNEIKKRYPDEWVILVDLDVDSTTNVTGGRVFDHAPTKKAIHERLKDVNEEFAVLCTREPRGGIVVSMGLAKVDIPE